MEELITPSELANRWRMVTKTIHRRISDGSDMPKSILIGSRRRFRLIDVINWEKTHEELTNV